MQRLDGLRPEKSGLLTNGVSLRSLGSIRQITGRLARTLIAPSRKAPPLPRIRVNRTGNSVTPTAWFICPDFDRPSGGIRKLYRFVDILDAAGMRASILHGKRGFRCSWFNHRTNVASSHEVTIRPNDLLVVPEIYGAAIRSLPAHIRQVILNQNAYITVQTLADDPDNASPYVGNPDLAAVLAVSQDNIDVLSYLFPAAPIKRLRLGIDPALHYLPDTPKQRRIIYMPRKRPGDASLILEMLKQRGALDGWDVMAIEGLSEAKAAELLRSATIFLSFSSLEGFGLPPLEAIACGCTVVGYHGFGGREYFHPPYATAVEDGDTVAFARAVETCMRHLDSGQDSQTGASADAIRLLTDSYSLEAERMSVTEAFKPFLKL